MESMWCEIYIYIVLQFVIYDGYFVYRDWLWFVSKVSSFSNKIISHMQEIWRNVYKILILYRKISKPFYDQYSVTEGVCSSRCLCLMQKVEYQAESHGVSKSFTLSVVFSFSLTHQSLSCIIYWNNKVYQG